MDISLPGKALSPEQGFWNWFVKNEELLFSFETNQEKIFKALSGELRKIHPNLTFEFGPIVNNGREFVISAGGIKNAFPAVVSLADAAPTLPRWKITKFRPRRDEIASIRVENTSISPEDVQFTIESRKDKANIVLFLGEGQNYDENIHANIGFLFLDQILGEYDVEMFVGSIDFRPFSTPSRLAKAPLTHLRSTFDKLFKPKIN